MKTTIRKAVPNDIRGIVDLGLEALRYNSYPNLIVSKSKVHATAVECVSSARNFAYVAEKEGEIVGAVSALVHPMMFHERSQATVVQFYCKEAGEGVKLIRAFLKWAKSRPLIKMVVFTLEVKADPRIGKLLTRLGLQTELPVYLKTM